MAPTSFANAKSDLFSRLCSNTTTGAPHSSLTDLTRIYDHEPLSGDIAKPLSLTISTLGADPDFFKLEVRIYAADATQKITQDRLDAACQQVEDRLGSEFGPPNWEIGWVDEIGAWVARSELMVGRQDYY